jgi:hypothetical protein
VSDDRGPPDGLALVDTHYGDARVPVVGITGVVVQFDMEVKDGPAVGRCNGLKVLYSNN